MSVLQYASWMEVFQLILASVGLGFALWGIWVAFEDAIELTDAPPDDLRRLVALSNMRAQLARVSAQGVLVFVGVVSVLLPPPSADIAEIGPELEQSLLVRMGLILVTMILTTDSLMERRQRHYFMGRIVLRNRTAIRAPDPTTKPHEVAVMVGGKEVARGEINMPSAENGSAVLPSIEASK